MPTLFTAPSVTTDTDYEFMLTVSDPNGGIATDTVVTVMDRTEAITLGKH